MKSKEQIYIETKKQIKKYINTRKFFSAMKLIRFCANDRYIINDRMYDIELEDFLRQIAIEYQKKIKQYSKQHKKKIVMFYDQVSIYNRTLSKIYLQALVQIPEIEVIYIGKREDSTNCGLYKICREHNIPYIMFVKKYTRESLELLFQTYNTYQPDIILSQNHVDDFVGVIFNYALENKTKRFLINITDHAFWIGQGAYDKIIEFRNYGANVTRLWRNIPVDFQIKLPYYAESRKFPYEGLPFSLKQKRLVLSGGSIYKTQGDSANTFYRVIHYILDQFPDTIFLYLGNGAEKVVMEQMKGDTYKNRVFVLEERRDLDEILKRAVLYVNTYPLTGGLMTSFALKNDVIPITLTQGRQGCDISDFVADCDYKFCFEDVDSMLHEIDMLLENEGYRKEAIRKLHGQCIDERLFTKNLKTILLEEQSEFEIKEMSLDLKKETQMYQLLYEGRYPETIFSSKSLYLWVRYPKYLLRGLKKAIPEKLRLIIQEKRQAL